MKSDWRELERDSPGERFKNRYERKHEGGRGGGSRFVTLGAAGLLIAVGVFLLPAPGPGFIVVLLGAALLAQESLIAARALDRVEVWGRAAVSAALRLWKRASVLGRIALALGVALVVAGLGWLAYLAIFARD